MLGSINYKWMFLPRFHVSKKWWKAGRRNKMKRKIMWSDVFHVGLEHLIRSRGLRVYFYWRSKAKDMLKLTGAKACFTKWQILKILEWPTMIILLGQACSCILFSQSPVHWWKETTNSLYAEDGINTAKLMSESMIHAT